jgi:hypothetical protein
MVFILFSGLMAGTIVITALAAALLEYRVGVKMTAEMRAWEPEARLWTAPVRVMAPRARTAANLKISA